MIHDIILFFAFAASDVTLSGFLSLSLSLAFLLLQASSAKQLSVSGPRVISSRDRNQTAARLLSSSSLNLFCSSSLIKSSST